MMETKGGTIQHLVPYIKEKFGEEAYQKWLDTLPPESQKIYSAQILPSMWYPVKEASRIPTETMIKLFFDSDPKKAIDVGIYTAEKMLKGIYKAFIKFGSPSFIISKSSSMLATLYRPAELEVVDIGSNNSIVRFTEFPEMYEALEYATIGFVQTIHKLCGCKDIDVRINASITRGDPYTEIEATWK
jgi:hypothetical protein